MGAVELRRWSREEYEKMVDAGVFAPGERAELIDGEIFGMTPQKSAHAAAVCAAQEALLHTVGVDFHIRVQLPLALGAFSEPEPDISVVRGSWRNYRDAHPSAADLIVEISDASLQFDRQRKGRIYAGAGIPDYWIVNLVDRCLEVYRQPSGLLYEWSKILRPGDRIAPLAAPGSPISVDDLLP